MRSEMGLGSAFVQMVLVSAGTSGPRASGPAAGIVSRQRLCPVSRHQLAVYHAPHSTTTPPTPIVWPQNGPQYPKSLQGCSITSPSSYRFSNILRLC